MDFKKKTNLPEESAIVEVGKLLLTIFERIIESQEDDMPFYDNADLKRIYHVSDSWIYRMRKSNQLKFKKIGRKYFYPKVAIKTFKS